MTPELLADIREKNGLARKYKRNSNNINATVYKKYCHGVNERLKFAKHQYILGKLYNASISENQWGIINSIINPKSNPVINSIEQEGNMSSMIQWKLLVFLIPSLQK